MKKLAGIALGMMLAVAASASSEGFEKKGFLTTKWCVANDMFKDCRLETVVCGYEGCNKNWEFGDPMKEELVLYVHDDGKYYKVDLGHIERSELDEAVNRNEVTLIGSYDEKANIIHVKEFKAPPPPKKSFFKGCL
ncbi:MAG: hypothetical protein DSY46_07645 [Hydrogenimonas sp.]|nr:MAG: hypothetical protein DSY46_07645 [Hydrogenimonas sp.]